MNLHLYDLRFQILKEFFLHYVSVLYQTELLDSHSYYGCQKKIKRGFVDIPQFFIYIYFFFRMGRTKKMNQTKKSSAT